MTGAGREARLAVGGVTCWRARLHGFVFDVLGEQAIYSGAGDRVVTGLIRPLVVAI